MHQSVLPLNVLLCLVGHLAAVHRSKRSCFQEHQDHRWVPGWWADQCSQGKFIHLYNECSVKGDLLYIELWIYSCFRVHLTPMLSRRRTSWRELPSPTVKHVCFVTKQINLKKFLLIPWVFNVLKIGIVFTGNLVSTTHSCLLSTPSLNYSSQQCCDKSWDNVQI